MQGRKRNTMGGEGAVAAAAAAAAAAVAPGKSQRGGYIGSRFCRSAAAGSVLREPVSWPLIRPI